MPLERKKFVQNEIEGILSRVSEELDGPATGYIIGGLAMMRHGVKLATKDVDIVFRKYAGATAFILSLERLGFNDTAPESRKTGARKRSWRMEGPGNMRFDVFFRTVCDCLVVSGAMANRASKYPLRGKLALRVIAPEDLFLLKSVTGREDDLADMSLVAGMGLDWDIIEEELRSQPDFWKWVAHHYVKLGELEAAFSVRSPLKRRFARDAELAAGIACLNFELEKRPISVKDARLILNERTEKFGEEVLKNMVELGLVRKAKGKFYGRRRNV